MRVEHQPRFDQLDWKPRNPMSQQVMPQACPDPQTHETFNYCPYCSWTRPECGEVLTLGDNRFGCNQPEGHGGSHTHRLSWPR